MKISLMLMLGLVTFMLASCRQNTVSMKNIDEHLDQTDIVYIDLRSWDEVIYNGQIRGFSIIQYYEDLELPNILVRTNNWQFEPASIVNEEALRAHFDETKTLYIMCRTGNRSGFVVAALKHLGYENVYNIGGIVDYTGPNRIFP